MSPIESALDELHRALEEFVLLLEREAEALQHVQAETLTAIVAEKNRWSDTANTAWNRMVVASGIDPRRGETLDNVLSANPSLLPKWHKIRLLAEKAERINSGNNILIEAQLLRTRQALDVLQSAANRGNLYGANGQMMDGFQSRHTLDKA
jgi:flagellar biosynthesis/type III secretory pathway chaperone